MNVNAIESMENFAKQVLTLPEESRNDFFESLNAFLNDDEILMLKKCVGIYHIMTEPALYKAIEKSLGEQLHKEFNQ
jgi:hypothetical protein